MRARNRYGRRASKRFGECMRSWRAAARLSQADAATKLGLLCQRPQAYLSQMETGKLPVPDALLVKVPDVYGVPPRQVLEEAYGIQLPLTLPAVASDPAGSALPEAAKTSGAVVTLTESDRLALAQFAEFLAFRRAGLADAPSSEVPAGGS